MRSDLVSISQCVASPVWLECLIWKVALPRPVRPHKPQQHQSRSLTRIAGTWRITGNLIDDDEDEDLTLATPACIDIDDGEDDVLEESAENELRACTTVVLKSGLNSNLG